MGLRTAVRLFRNGAGACYTGHESPEETPHEAADQPLLHCERREQPGGRQPPDAAKMGAARAHLSSPRRTVPPQALLLAGHRAGPADSLLCDPQACPAPAHPLAITPWGCAQDPGAGDRRWPPGRTADSPPRAGHPALELQLRDW